MARKPQNKLDALAESLNSLGTPVVEAGRDIWLAGLGALSVARQEGGKVADRGTKIFDTLVSEGRKYEKKTGAAARKEAREVADRVAAAAVRAARTLQKEPLSFHLVPSDDKWVVRLEGSDENLSLHETKDTAVGAGRGIARAHEPSRLVVHRADGTIQTSYTYE